MAEPGRVKFLFFWGHRPQHGGGIGPGCLSQWWPSAFSIDGVQYATAEHYMMAAKARLFGDDRALEQILAAPSPGAAKALGRHIRGFNEGVWQAHRFEVVVAANVAKFAQHPDLRTYLLGTRGRILVEASPVDRIWGIGLTTDDPRAADPARWPGLNLLGFALMQARTDLAASAPSSDA
jgi:ribA/ribD-fused uncharacterized protein